MCGEFKTDESMKIVHIPLVGGYNIDQLGLNY
jgi:hypothetical protein